MTTKITLLSLGYWFSSRSLGLLNHPYLTMRVMMREKFLRPLTYLPAVTWLLLWFISLIIAHAGPYLPINPDLKTTIKLSLLFLWLWASVFLVIWQIVLFYLKHRFQNIE